MKAKIDRLNQTIHLDTSNFDDFETMQYAFTKKIRDWQFKTRGKAWDGSVSYMSRNGDISIGFYRRLLQIAKRNNIPIEWEGDLPNNPSVKREDVEKVMRAIKKHVLPDYIHLRDYQIQANYMFLKYAFGNGSLATSAGKTLISFFYYLCLRKFAKKVNFHKLLIVTDDPDLVIQGYNDWLEYADGKVDLKMQMASGKTKPKGEYKVVWGNWQTLIRMDKLFFQQFSHMILDEGQRISSKSLRKIVDMASNRTSSIAISGSIEDDDSADHFNLEKYAGGELIKVTKKQLMEMGYATPVKIKVIVLDYLPLEDRKRLALDKYSGRVKDIDQFDRECMIYRNSSVRTKWISEFLSDMNEDTNTVVYYNSVKTGYGEQLLQETRRKAGNQNFYYVNGEVKKKLRQDYYDRLKKTVNNFLFATYNTFGVGKSIPNLHKFLMAEPVKSDNIVGQAMGRGMRQQEEKEEYVWYDVVDDFRCNITIDDGEGSVRKKFTNVLYNQFLSRTQQYAKAGFEYEVIKVKLNDRQQSIF